MSRSSSTLPFLQSLGFGQILSSCIFRGPTRRGSVLPNWTDSTSVHFASLSGYGTRPHLFGSLTSSPFSRWVRLLEPAASAGRRCDLPAGASLGSTGSGPGGATRASAAAPVALRALRPRRLPGARGRSKTRCARLKAGRCKAGVQQRSKTHPQHPKLRTGGPQSQRTSTLAVFRGLRPGWGHCKDQGRE